MIFLYVLWVVAWAISFFCIFWIALALCMGVGEIMRDFPRKKHELYYCALVFVVVSLAFASWIRFGPIGIDYSNNDLAFKWTIKSNEEIQHE